MLEVSQVQKTFGATKALDGVSFCASPGRVLAVVGENGSGKSTLMRIISGEAAPDEGSVRWKGEKITGRDPRIHLVHQELALCPHMNGAENVFLGMDLGPWNSPRGLLDQAGAILKDLGFGHIDPSLPASRLPVSQKQALEICRSVARRAEVVLFDEPTSSLAAHDKDMLFKLIQRLNERGILVLYISHFLEEIRAVSDDLLVLRDGAKVWASTLDEVTDDDIIHHMVGRDLTEVFPRSPRSPGEILLQIDSLSSPKGKPQEVSLEVRKGEVLGLAGLNGAGRTELVRTIMGLDKVSSGTVRVAEWSPRSPRSMWSRGAGFVSEERKVDGLALGMSIAENIDLPRHRGFLRLPSEQNSQAGRWIESLRIRCQGPEQPVGRLSGGNQQKAAIARLLHAECDLFLLDEPTRGIDVGSKAEIYRLIDEAAARGCAVLMTSSHLPELLGVCDRIGVMNRGRLAAVMPGSEATQESLMEACLR